MKSLVPVLLLILAAPALGEVVHLNDGTTLEGDLRRTNEGWMVTAADGKVTVVTPSQVKSIEFKKTGSPADSADQGLASLRRAVANQGDLSRIVDRFKSFIAQHSGTAAAKDAETDLAVWQDRLDKGLVRAGDQWVTKDQLSELQAKAAQAASAARSLIDAGKLTDATAAIDRALAISPQNAALLYLKGVLLFRQGQIAPARDAFRAAAAVVPDHAPTHNNIAVILQRQRAPMTALGEYDKAMLADPQNQTILDNVHEALHALPAEFKNKDLTKKVKEHFADQDAALQKTMAAKGQYRWGSQWLDEKEYNRIQAQQKAVQDKIDSMQKDFDNTKAILLKLDRDIISDQNLAQAMAAQSVQTDPTTGRTYSLPLPQRYYDLLKDIANLKSEKVLRQRQLEDLQKMAAQQKQLMPQEKFTGVQKAFDADAAPGIGVSRATSPGLASMANPPATSKGSGPAVPPTTAPAASTGGADFGTVVPSSRVP